MRFNILYLLLILGIVFFLPMTKFINKNPVVFYGIAETETRSVNLEYPVIIEDMKVILGEKVKAGQLLAVLHRTSLPIKINDINYELKELSSKKGINSINLEGDITKLEGQRALIQTEFDNKIAQLEAEMTAQEKIIEGLKTIDAGQIKSPLQGKIDALRSELSKKLTPIETAIESRKKDLRAANNLVDVRVNKLQGELNLIQKQEDALQLTAPIDGIIGQLNFLSGENVDSYSNILKIYGERPNVVTTYVADGQLAQIEMGDTLDIASINVPEYLVEGIVIGLGTRVTQLPERLRKIPQMKAWGREVQLKIPAENNFLQGEKVKVSLRKMPPPPMLEKSADDFKNPKKEAKE